MRFIFIVLAFLLSSCVCNKNASDLNHKIAHIEKKYHTKIGVSAVHIESGKRLIITHQVNSQWQVL